MLALLAQAAEGNTYEEIKRGLNLTVDKTLAADQYQEKYNLLQKGIGQAVLSVVNQIYVQEGHQLKKAFRDVAVDKFASGIESISFTNPVESAQTINQFVENKTDHLIKDLIKPDILLPSTRMVLVNAIYFKGNWKYPFDKKRTTKGDFYISRWTSVQADFMHTTRMTKIRQIERSRRDRT